jgi:hypothetical protein
MSEPIGRTPPFRWHPQRRRNLLVLADALRGEAVCYPPDSQTRRALNRSVRALESALWLTQRDAA